MINAGKIRLKQKAFLVCLWIFVFASTSLNADGLKGQSPLVRADSRCVCDPEANDILENPKSFNFGVFDGSCLDSCRFRKSELTHSGGSIRTVTNVMHDERFWSAQIPKNGVESVEIGFEEFQTGVFHVFLFFRLAAKTPVTLTNQKGGQNKKTQIFSLAFSPEGIPPRDKSYNLFDAFFERYIVGHRLLSAEQLIAYSVKKLGHKVTLYKLNLDKNQMKKLFDQTMKMATQKSFETKYRLFSNNCSTNILDAIENVAPKTAAAPVYLSPLLSLERALSISGPIGTVRILASRGLIDRTRFWEVHPELKAH